MRKLTLLAVVAMLAACSNPKSENTDTTAETKPESMLVEKEIEGEVFFVAPAEGDSVSNPVKLTFGVKGMEVEPAGAVNEGKGHHHIIIDGTFIEKGTGVPMDSMNIHYGKGQTETELTLTPGKHTLTMQFADGFHQSYGEAWSKTIEVIVVENN